jgi:hypothetical protein
MSIKAQSRVWLQRARTNKRRFAANPFQNLICLTAKAANPGRRIIKLLPLSLFAIGFHAMRLYGSAKASMWVRFQASASQ